MDNPFVYGRVIDGEDIANRRSEWTTLQEAMTGGHNTLVMSERQMGKTSLCRAAADEAEDLRYAYVDLWPTDNRVDFARAVAKGVAGALQTPTDKALQTLQDWFQSFRVLSGVDEGGDLYFSFDFQGHSDDLDLGSILRTPEQLNQRADTNVAVILDEIQVIDQYPDDYVERKLRSVIQHHNDIAYTFLGSRRHTVQQMFHESSRPFYKSAKTITLDPIAVGDWIPYIKTRFEDGGRAITKDQIEQICDYTEGHPAQTQHLCHALFNRVGAGEAVSGDDIEQALEQVLDQRSYAYTNTYENLSRNQRKLLLGLSHEGRSAQIYSEQFISDYNLSTTGSSQKASEALKRKGFIDQDEQGYYLTDRFLVLWLQRRIDRP